MINNCLKFGAMVQNNPSKNLFIRQSSGLVREVSPWSSSLATFGLVTGGVPILIIEWLFLSPGANLPLSFFISLLPTLLMASLFFIASVSMPRAGGDYVFNSRATNPMIGFVNYWGLWIAFALSLGIYSFYGAQWFAYLFTGLGIYFHNSLFLSLGNFFDGKIGEVSVGLVIVLFSSVIASLGKDHWKFIIYGGLISVVTTIIMFIGLVTITPSSFASSLSSVSGVPNAYTKVIHDAESNGLTFFSPLSATLLALPVVWYYYAWYNLPASWSGEMKSVKKNVFYSIVFTIAMVGVYYAIFSYLNIHAFGQKFLTSWSYIDCNGISDPVYSSLQDIGPFTPFFALIVDHNVLLYIIMFIALWLPNFYSNPPLVVALTRYMFAWSFDRIMPEWMADVNERYHIPLKSTILVSIIGLAGVLMYAFIPAISTVDVTIVFQIGYAVFALSTALMPYVKKRVYENAVPFKRKLLGVPIISIIGFLTFGFLIYTLALTWNNSFLLPINVSTIGSLIAIYGSGILIYYLAKLYTKRRIGIDMEMLFEEIPPE
ncbi:APC family permease [Sulfuracidifex metallicus]|nr:APC family permease [Sulfuracidifex metallicus]